MFAKTKTFLLALLIVFVTVIPVHPETLIFVHKYDYKPMGMAIASFTDSEYVHVGLKVDDITIEHIGHLDIDRNDNHDEAIYLDPNIDLEPLEAIKRAKAIYTENAGIGEMLKVWLNREFGFKNDSKKMTCASLVASILGLGNPQNFYPKDFVSMYPRTTKR